MEAKKIFSSIGNKIKKKNDFSDSRFKIWVSSDYSRIRISDIVNYDGHYLNFEFNDSSDVMIASHSLPETDSINSLFKQFRTIDSHLNTFLSVLVELNEFYNNMFTIDELCLVVDPVEITTKSNTRTFKIEGGIYIKIIVDPMEPSSIVTRLIGPPYRVEVLREQFAQKLIKWDETSDIHTNLLRIFEKIFFPIKPQFLDADDSMNELEGTKCSICFAYRMDKQIPYISCDNQKCCSIYHLPCLKKWFSTLPDTKTFCNIAFGTCPYCKEVSLIFSHSAFIYFN